jgi:hypothetical protein
MIKVKFMGDRKSLTDNTIGHIPTGTGGVYIIFRMGRPYYIGRSQDNVKGRLRCHLHCRGNRNVGESIRKGEDLTFAYEEVMSFEQLEANLIQVYGESGKLGNLRFESDPADRF